MQIDRLLDTLIFLLKYKKTTAQELAQRFQVSTRTIYRDVDTLSLSGIPVYCTQGNNGGIFLNSDYLLERNFLTKTEKEQMTVALHLLKSTNLFPIDRLLDKYTLLQNTNDEDWISWELNESDLNTGLQNDFLVLKQAITEHKKLQFIYYSSFGQTALKTVLPCRIIYRQNSWNLLGYCSDNREYQIYLISHIKSLQLLNESFILPKPILFPDQETITVRLKFSKRISYKMYDDFYQKDITQNKDGSYEVSLKLLNNDSLYTYLLSFGNNVEILSPVWLKEKLVKKLYSFLETNQI